MTQQDSYQTFRLVARWTAVVTLVALAAAAVLLLWFRRQQPAPNLLSENATKQPDSASNQPLPLGDFAGSDACRDCHDAIYRSYFTTHGMGNSAASWQRAEPIEDYQQAEFRTPDGRSYQVLHQSDQCVHREFFRDEQGELLFDESVAIEYVIGSGARGRGYVFTRDGRMYQSPISWYTQRHCWDLSPGYLPGQHARFLRRITEDCLFCHVGRIAVKTGQHGFANPPILEEPIGCERCHGPAGEHVRRRSAGDVDDSLPRLASLPPEQRDAICWQCHLRATVWISHPGKHRFSFRPGDLLEDHGLVIPEEADAELGQPGASVVLQLVSSTCYLKSQGKLGCISCHDPHSRPPATDRASYYQQKCFACHDDNSCALDEVARQTSDAQGKCVVCHMPRLPTPAVPHTALTDHRILRKADSKPVTGSATTSLRQFFREGQWQLPAHVVQRARGIAWAERATAGDPSAAGEAIRLLEPLRGTSPRDIPLLLYLGSAYAVSRRFDSAQATWEAVLQLDGQHEDALRFLALLKFAGGDSQGVVDTIQRWKSINPDPPELYYLESKALSNLGRVNEAIEAARQAVERDPTGLASRKWLADLLESQGRHEEAARERNWIERYVAAMRSAAVAPTHP